MSIHNQNRYPHLTKAVAATFMCAGFALSFVSQRAAAQVTFDVIGPHEYDLPVNYQPWNVFVQYATVQNTNEVWDGSGNSVSLNPQERSLVGLSKWVHFFTVDSLPNVGMGFEVIQPEVSVRTRAVGNTPAYTASGFGDTMIGYAIWYKPTEGSTLGFQTFLQMPIGSSNVSDTNWKNLSSVLWYIPFGSRFGWTGDLGLVFQTPRDDGVKPGTTVHTNNRFGFKLNDTFEPFLALDYERTGQSSVRNQPNLPSAYAFDAGVGTLINLYKNQSLTLRYSRGIDGENHSLTNSIDVKYVYVF
jgi:hypothetical protein